jgi:death-on-curing protein
MNEPVWLPTELVITSHEELREFGGPEGLRDIDGPESALGRPKNRWAYEGANLAALAAAYAFGTPVTFPLWTATSARHLSRLLLFSVSTASSSWPMKPKRS